MTVRRLGKVLEYGIERERESEIKIEREKSENQRKRKSGGRENERIVRGERGIDGLETRNRSTQEP